MSETYPGHVATFRMSVRWFAGFCRRNKISLRRKIHASQKTPEPLRSKSISKLHAKTSREREEKARHIYFNGIVIMNQTPFLFVLDNNETYDKKGVEEMLNASDQSSLEKRQRTIQLTVFTEG